MLLTISRKYVVILIISKSNYNVHSEAFEMKISLVNWYISFISKAMLASETIVIIKLLLYFALFYTYTQLKFQCFLVEKLYRCIPNGQVVLEFLEICRMLQPLLK